MSRYSWTVEACDVEIGMFLWVNDSWRLVTKIYDGPRLFTTIEFDDEAARYSFFPSAKFLHMKEGLSLESLPSCFTVDHLIAWIQT